MFSAPWNAITMLSTFFYCSFCLFVCLFIVLYMSLMRCITLPCGISGTHLGICCLIFIPSCLKSEVHIVYRKWAMESTDIYNCCFVNPWGWNEIECFFFQKKSLKSWAWPFAFKLIKQWSVYWLRLLLVKVQFLFITHNMCLFVPVYQ